MQDEICKLPALTFLLSMIWINYVHVDVLTESQAEFFPWYLCRLLLIYSDFWAWDSSLPSRWTALQFHFLRLDEQTFVWYGGPSRDMYFAIFDLNSLTDIVGYSEFKIDVLSLKSEYRNTMVIFLCLSFKTGISRSFVEYQFDDRKSIGSRKQHNFQ